VFFSRVISFWVITLLPFLLRVGFSFLSKREYQVRSGVAGRSSHTKLPANRYPLAGSPAPTNEPFPIGQKLGET
jgi:hypothetical protein